MSESPHIAATGPGGDDEHGKLQPSEPVLERLERAILECDAVQACVLRVGDHPEPGTLVAYLSPSKRYLEAIPENDGAAHVADWTKIQDEFYGSRKGSFDVTSDFSGWISSYTGTQIEPEQMQEWLDGTMSRIRGLAPRTLLEIGCGTGLLLFRYAPTCESVHAIDISATVLARIQRELDSNGWRHVHLSQGDALSIDRLPEGTFDTVVVNSVAQHFPNAAYFERMVNLLLGRVRDGGALFFGDIRNLDLLEPHACAIERSHVTDSVPIAVFRQRVTRRMQQEKELLLSPAYFVELARSRPDISHADILVKRGIGDNEMMRYRYDVVLHKSGGGSSTAACAAHWIAAPTLQGINEALSANEHPVLGVSGVVNSRVRDDVELAARIGNIGSGGVVPPNERAGRLSTAAGAEVVAFENLLRRAEDSGYVSYVTWSSEGLDRIDLIFARQGCRPVINARGGYARDWKANYPKLASHTRALSGRVSAWLREKGETLVPDACVVLEQLPLTSDGVVNVEALPLPNNEDLGIGEYSEPRSEMEARMFRYSRYLNRPRMRN